MTKAELIAALEDMPDDAPVYIDTGYGVQYSRFTVSVYHDTGPAEIVLEVDDGQSDTDDGEPDNV